MTKTKSFIEWPEKLDEEQEKDYQNHLKEIHYSALWDDFYITKDPQSLAIYIRAGGDIDDKMTRDILTSLLDKVPYKRSRKRPFAHKSIDTYLDIELNRHDLNLSISKAIVHYSEKNDLSDETVKSRYKSGKKWLTDAFPRSV
jgi:hypothetical protein